MTRMEGLLSRGARIILQKGILNWLKTASLRELGWMTLAQTAAATSMKIMLKVMHNKSPQNLYAAQVNKKARTEDEIKSFTETDLRQMTKLHRKSWSVRCLRWYQTLQGRYS